MNEFDHNSRINQLEKKIEHLENTLKNAGLLSDFTPLSQAAKLLGLNSWVIRNRINNDPTVQLNYHYRMNGNRYQVNVLAYQSLLAADAKAKQNQNASG